MVDSLGKLLHTIFNKPSKAKSTDILDVVALHDGALLNLKQNITTLEVKVKELTEKDSKLTAKIYTLERSLTAFQEENEDLKKQLVHTNSTLLNAQKEISSLITDLQRS